MTDLEVVLQDRVKTEGVVLDAMSLADGPEEWRRTAVRVARRLQCGEVAVMPATDEPEPGARILLLSWTRHVTGFLLTPNQAASLIGRLANAVEATTRHLDNRRGEQ